MVRLAVTTALGGLVAAALTACAPDSDSADGALTQVDLVLPAPMGLDWAAFLVADEEYWPDMDLAVTGVGTDGSSSVVQQLVAGNAQFGIASAQAVYAGALEGADVTAIAMMTHGDVAMLSVPADSEIESAADLQGLAVGVTSATDGALPIVAAVMGAAGVTEWAEPIVGAGGAAVVNAFQTGQIQAFAHGGGDLIAMEMGAGMEMRSIMPEPLATLPGNMLVVRNDVLADPVTAEVAFKLASGWLQAAGWMLENEAQAVEISCAAAPEGCSDPEIAEYSVRLAAEGTAPLTQELGFIDDAAMTRLLQAVYGTLEIPLSEVFTNEYVDEIAKY